MHIKELCDYGSSEIEQLRAQINRNKRFLGMVIHDFRNPTVSVKLGLEASHNDLHEALQILLNEQKGFSKRSLKLLELLKASKAQEKEAEDLSTQV